ncbi:MAG: flavodoxin domain-containing protein [Candidatus Hodarchaeales archaeon]
MIVFASRFGSAGEIAEELAEELEKNGMRTEVLDLKNLKNKYNILPLEEFDGIIVGSGIKMGRWTEEALKFLEINKEILNQRPLGLFVSSGEAANPLTYPLAHEKYLIKIMEKLGITADMTEAFGGVFDFSSSSKYSFIEKKILKKIAKSNETGFIVHDGKLNDFRNWQLIRQWATDFSQLVKKLNNVENDKVSQLQ